MTFAAVACRAQVGLQAPLVRVEVSLGSGLPTFNIVGLPAAAVRESKDRVRAALIHSDFEFPAGRITVNLSPADVPKRGGRFDLPIAIGVLLASAQLRLRSAALCAPAIELYGELGLNGELKPVCGLLLAAAHAAAAGHEVIIPQGNAGELQVLLRAHGLTIFTADHLLGVCAHLAGRAPLVQLCAPCAPAFAVASGTPLDLQDVRGQLQAKRALTVAAAGAHSLIMIGPPGAGKSMLARRLAGLLPPLTEAEALEVAAIASIGDGGFNCASFGLRPVRTPHHTASAAALIGGGARARPGEISLAHRGILFLDELLEYDRRALEALREPLESGTVCITRAALQAQYPAEFQLVAAMNPCPCGRFGDAAGGCRCTPGEISQYRARISAPLLERLDIHVEVQRLRVSDFDEANTAGESSVAVAARVALARGAQLARQGVCNARLSDADTERICALDATGRALLAQAMQRFGFSARARQKILRLARTIADLGAQLSISARDVNEAVTYRALDRRVAGPSDR
ncbi:MAG TPA: YifB family Mg chelatase-like AAA ATPase [Steroidobacteraceae bacterium]